MQSHKLREPFHRQNRTSACFFARWNVYLRVVSAQTFLRAVSFNNNNNNKRSSASVCLSSSHGPQRPPLWRTRAGKTSQRQTTAAIQRCVQEGPKSLEHWPEQLWSNSPQMVSLETDCAERSLQLRRDARSAAQGKENEKKGYSPCRQASIRLRLCPLPHGLSFPHRTG